MDSISGAGVLMTLFNGKIFRTSCRTLNLRSRRFLRRVLGGLNGKVDAGLRVKGLKEANLDDLDMVGNVELGTVDVGEVDIIWAGDETRRREGRKLGSGSNLTSGRSARMAWSGSVGEPSGITNSRRSISLSVRVQ
jgi:hypothetical protein